MNWLKRNASTILTFLGAGGMIATVVTAVKATPRAHQRYVRAKRESETGKLTPMQTVRTCGRDYAPAITLGVGTLACFFGANALSRRQQAALASAYTALLAYKDKVRDILGPGTDEMIEHAVEQEARDKEADRPPWDEPQTFYLECLGRGEFFERSMTEVLRAEYEANRYFILKGSMTLNDLCDIFKLDEVEGGYDRGWEDYLGETRFGYGWIDFEHHYIVMDDGLTVCAIRTPFGPHSFDEDEVDKELEYKAGAVAEAGQ